MYGCAVGRGALSNDEAQLLATHLANGLMPFGGKVVMYTELVHADQAAR